MLSAITPTQPHEYTEMSRLADYFVVVGYDHEKESESLLRSYLKFVIKTISLSFFFLAPFFLILFFLALHIGFLDFI